MNTISNPIKRLFAFAVVSGAALSVQGMASAAQVTVTFDDLSTNGLGIGTDPIPSPYAGLNWSCPGGCGAVNIPQYSSIYSSGYPGALVSSPNVLSTGGLTISPAAGGTFSFDSLYMAAAWRDGMNVAFTGYNGSTVVDSTTVTLGNAGVQDFATLDWNNLTSFTIATSGGTPSTIYTAGGGIYTIGIDNLTYETPVPLPASTWLLLSGLGGFIALGRKRKVC